MSKQIKERLEKTHFAFLKSVKNCIVGEVLVGSAVYAQEKYLSEKSDLDIVCIVDQHKLNDFFSTKYLVGLMNPVVALEML